MKKNSKIILVAIAIIAIALYAGSLKSVVNLSNVSCTKSDTELTFTPDAYSMVSCNLATTPNPYSVDSVSVGTYIGTCAQYIPVSSNYNNCSFQGTLTNPLDSTSKSLSLVGTISGNGCIFNYADNWSTYCGSDLRLSGTLKFSVQVAQTCESFGYHTTNQTDMKCIPVNVSNLNCFSCIVNPTCVSLGYDTSPQDGMNCIPISTNGLNCYSCVPVTGFCSTTYGKWICDNTYAVLIIVAIIVIVAISITKMRK